MSHTQEPWRVSGTEHIVAVGQYVVALDCRPDDARRIVACVNACAGMTDEQVSHGLVSASAHSVLANQRDDLLSALKAISKITYDAGFNIGGPLEHCPGDIDADEAKRLLSLACEYLKDTSKAAGAAIAKLEKAA